MCHISWYYPDIHLQKLSAPRRPLPWSSRQQGIEKLDNPAGVSAAEHSALDTDRNPCLPVESSLSSSRYEHCVPHLVAQWRDSGSFVFRRGITGASHTPLILFGSKKESARKFNSLNAELNPICHLLALLGDHHILHVSRMRVKPLCLIFPK